MKPGPELDALVAEKVMGWTYEKAYDAWNTGNGCTRPRAFWSPSRDYEDAFKVVERMHESDQWRFALEFSGRKCHVEATFDVWNPEGHLVAKEWGEEHDGPYVICLAALKAVGVDV